MGIPLFWNALKGTLELDLNNASFARLRGIKPTNVRSLSIDANSVFHLAASYSEKVGDYDDPDDRERILALDDETRFKKIIDLTIRLIKEIIDYYNPTDVIIIAVDGPIPMTKIQQQKQRRYRAGMDIVSGLEYDSNMITPGTDFMRALDAAIYEQIYNVKYKFNVKEIIYDSHLSDGEGEHKIFDHLRRRVKYDNNAIESHVIYGNDSDLILLCMVSPIEKLYLSKDDVAFNLRKYQHRGETIIINDLRKRILDKLDDEIRDAGAQEENAPDILDFVFAMSFIGNDFLPASPVMAVMTRALNYVFRGLAQSGRIIQGNSDADAHVDWEAALRFIEYLSDVEIGNGLQNGLGLLLADSDREKLKSNPDDTFIPLQSELLELRNDSGGLDYDMFRSGWYVKALRGIKIVNQDIMKMCSSYLLGLNWVFNYYLHGHNSVTWLWYYPFFYAPMIRDIHVALISILDNPDKTVISTIDDTSPFENEDRITVLHQLVAVMPRQSMKHIPKLLHPFYDIDNTLSPMIPSSVAVDMDLIERKYQAKTILPMANYYRIMQELSYIEINDRELTMYRPKKHLSNAIDDRTEAQRYIAEKSRKIVQQSRGAFQPRGRGGPPSSTGPSRSGEKPSREGFSQRGGFRSRGFRPRGSYRGR